MYTDLKICIWVDICPIPFPFNLEFRNWILKDICYDNCSNTIKQQFKILITMGYWYNNSNSASVSSEKTKVIKVNIYLVYLVVGKKDS